MMKSCLILDRDFVLAPVDPRLFGGFVEHLGRCVYTGIVEPGHPTADGQGFRRDVLELVRELRMPVMRYPGGNFVSGYRWEDGIGPAASRPRRLDLAWKSLEPNTFGVDEFVSWCRKAETAPMLAVNLGTRGADEARNLVEYCNHPGGTEWSDLRRRNGSEHPHDIRLWCLGNEMDGSWQIGHKTAAEYGALAREAAKLMKWADPSIELVVCGSSNRGMSTFGQWELDVLEQAFDHVDYLSIHTYYGNPDNQTPAFLARPEEMGDFIRESAALCDAAAARRHSPKRIHLSFDEWNVWFHSHGAKAPPDWSPAPPLLEDVYTMEDALCVGGMLITLLNHCDRVKIACLAQLVNVIAPIMTLPGGPAWRQTIFYPFLHASTLGRGTVLRAAALDSPRYDAPGRPGVPFLSIAPVLSEDRRSLTIFALNRSLREPMRLDMDLRGFGRVRPLASTLLRHRNLKATNTQRAPDRVVPQPGPRPAISGGRLQAQLPPASWNVIQLSVTPDSSGS